MPDLIFIFALALVIVGPKKLPEVARQVGKFMAEFKRASNDFKHQLESEMMNIELEERTKKQSDNPQGAQVPPKEEPWERLMKPLTESVSRTKQEFAAMVNPEASAKTTATPDQPAHDQADRWRIANASRSRNRPEACLGRDDRHELPRAPRGTAAAHHLQLSLRRRRLRRLLVVSRADLRHHAEAHHGRRWPTTISIRSWST